MTGTRLVVAGVDGSSQSMLALRWALEEARLRGARLQCVCAWTVVTPTDPVGLGARLMSELREELAESAGKTLAAAVAELGADGTGVEIEWVVAEGPAGRVLVEAAADAELLVVGSRGHGGFAGVLLGSVGQQCAHHAPCPVAIVRSPGDGPDPG